MCTVLFSSHFLSFFAQQVLLVEHDDTNYRMDEYFRVIIICEFSFPSCNDSDRHDVS